MITKIRMLAATTLMWIGANVGPREMRPVITSMIDAWAGIPGQRHQGRTGGLIMAPWWVDIKGENLARQQYKECTQTAYHVRQYIENPPPPGLCGEIPLPLEPRDVP
ncbi:hypothetical protein CC53_gp135 [Rhizobium phage vB_RleS_L338C]|uniref:hypothetical protein n=1 Tax=Rhizobium phage vB_RleS_L338C TaxID=1414737 RepID=UPI0003D81BBA|nr:hypothetical protein CC53_gp135 [Rhizobium phage vB_RleS_L338C]AHC30552.1 hypothetical protein L338C_135 [Rhizobium phage vB_RleS_L338C]QNH72140.1 hypothetical protein P11VFA_014 [Rhizobium phage P11VFA]